MKLIFPYFFYRSVTFSYMKTFVKPFGIAKISASILHKTWSDLHLTQADYTVVLFMCSLNTLSHYSQSQLEKESELLTHKTLNVLHPSAILLLITCVI